MAKKAEKIPAKYPDNYGMYNKKICKPIFVCCLPNSISLDNVKKFKDMLEALFADDYHVLVVAFNSDNFRCQAFYPDKLPVKDFEAFKKEVRKKWNQVS